MKPLDYHDASGSARYNAHTFKLAVSIPIACKLFSLMPFIPLPFEDGQEVWLLSSGCPPLRFRGWAVCAMIQFQKRVVNLVPAYSHHRATQCLPASVLASLSRNIATMKGRQDGCLLGGKSKY